MVAWVIVSVGFEVYVNAFATYDDTYGALGTTIAGLVWLWLTNLTLLDGSRARRRARVSGGTLWRSRLRLSPESRSAGLDRLVLSGRLVPGSAGA